MNNKSINVNDSKSKTKEEKNNKNPVIQNDYGLNHIPPLLLNPQKRLRKTPDFWKDQTNS